MSYPFMHNFAFLLNTRDHHTVKLSSRPQLARILEIDSIIRSQSNVTCSTLSRKLEVNVRTILRDLEFMRDRLKAPIVFDSSKQGYFYREPSFRLPYFQTSSGELVALLVAEKVLKQFKGTPFETSLRQAFDKLVALLPEQVSVHLAKVQESLSVTPTVLTIQNIETFNAITSALQNQQRLEIDYFTAGRNARSKRRIDPYHLTLIDGDWQIIAYCHQRNDVRMFAMHRVKAVSETGVTFEPPTKFKIEDYMKGSFRAVRGDQTRKVVIQFSPEVAPRIAEKIWHSTQVTRPLPDGGLELCLEVTALIEVMRWVLSWGKDCRVMQPRELITLVNHEVKEMMANSTRSRNHA